MLESARSRISDWNPQLVREIKGRWKGRNLTIAIGASLFSQLILYLIFDSKLPSVTGRTNRYCIGNPPEDSIHPSQFHNPPTNYCSENGAGEIITNWQLWWLDLFTFLSVSSLIILLVFGTYVLITNLVQEEQKGTLKFVRLSPRSVGNLLVGKMLGVPILVYTAIFLALPLHFIAGFSAGIPVSLILGFYLVVIASAAFFYSVALLYSLVTAGLGNAQTWLGTGFLFCFLIVASNLGFTNNLVNHNTLDWLVLFYPGKILPYLIGETPHSLGTIGYFHLKEMASLTWYDFPLWETASGAIALLLLNYAWWTYWVWQGLTRRFHNSKATLLSKKQSYWLTGSVTVSLVGFMYPTTDQPVDLIENFQWYIGLQLLVFFLLMAALSPHRQTLQDWARYRYQNNDRATRNLVTDLMKGEQSPASGAIALNLLSNIIIMLPALILLPFGSDRLEVFNGLLIASSAFLLYASLVQWVLFMKTEKRSLFAMMSVATVILIPTIVGAGLQLPDSVTLLFFPIPNIGHLSASSIFFTLLARWSIIIACNLQLTRQLKKAGASNSKALFSEQKSLS
ncbi:MAG: hypothetical protein ACLFRN_03695, partial [Halothece sp.]